MPISIRSDQWRYDAATNTCHFVVRKLKDGQIHCSGCARKYGHRFVFHDFRTCHISAVVFEDGKMWHRGCTAPYDPNEADGMSRTINFSPPVLEEDRSVVADQYTSGGGIVTRRHCYGLKNLGNTCYLSSMLQCLAHTVEIRQYFLSGNYKSHLNPEEKHLSTEFVILLGELWGVGNANDAANCVVDPSKFKAALDGRATQFQGKEQQDAQEFLAAFLMGLLHEDLNLVVNDKPPYEKYFPGQGPSESDDNAAARLWDARMSREDSYIQDMVIGQGKTQLICPKADCGTSTTYPPLPGCLAVPVPYSDESENGINVTHCIARCCDKVRLEEDEKWKCPNCNEKVRAEKTEKLYRPPPILIIQLKRFDGAKQVRINTLVKFPLKGLDLKDFVAGECGDGGCLTYDLYAVSNHVGELDKGHYTAYALSEDKSWIYFNDSNVRPVTNEDEIISPDAYCLFYRRNNLNSDAAL